MKKRRQLLLIDIGINIIGLIISLTVYPPAMMFSVIIAAATVAGNLKHKGIYYDGESHYYIDGSTIRSGHVPILMYDTKEKKFYEVTKSGNEELD